MAVDAAPTGITMSDESLTEDGESQSEDSTSADGRVVVVSSTEAQTRPVHAWRSSLLIAGVLAVLAGWLGHNAFTAHRDAERHRAYVDAARDGATYLTTIDHQHVDADVQRILAESTGAFHDDFAQRSKPFTDVVKQAQSTSVGTIIDAAVESEDGEQAHVLVAVSVNTIMAGQPEGETRSWRMRISVQRVDQLMKVSNVEFVA